jgi:hypothetical protein
MKNARLSANTATKINELAGYLRKNDLGLPQAIRPNYGRWSTVCIADLLGTSVRAINNKPIVRLLGQIADEIGLTPIATINEKLRCTDHPFRLVDKKRVRINGSAIKKLKDWGERLAQVSLQVPTISNKGFAYAVIADELDIPRGMVGHLKSGGNIIAATAERIGTMPVDEYLERRHGPNWRSRTSKAGYQEEAIEALHAYFGKLRTEGSSLPENGHDLGKPHYLSVYRDAHIAPPTGAREYARPAIEALIDEAAHTLGCGPYKCRPPLPIAGKQLTYAELSDTGIRKFEELAPSGKRRLMAALHRIMEHSGRTKTDPIGPELTIDAIATRQEIARRIENDSTRRHFLLSAERWAEIVAPFAYVEESINTANLPPDLAGTIRVLMAAKDIRNSGELAKAIGCSKNRTKRWMVVGTAVPHNDDDEHLPALASALGVDVSVLTSKIGPFCSLRRAYDGPPHGKIRQFKILEWPAFLQDRSMTKIRGKLRPLLPVEFPNWSAARREEICRSLIADLQTNDAYRKRLTHTVRTQFRHEPVPPNCQSEIADLIAFKTDRALQDQLRAEDREGKRGVTA